MSPQAEQARRFPYTYTPNPDGKTHKVVCSCGATINEEEAHDYTKDTEHKCVCGDVEHFTLTIESIAIADDGEWYWDRMTVSVPYGARICDLDEVTGLQSDIYVDSSDNKGVYNHSGFAFGSDESHMTNVSGSFGDLTMPGNDAFLCVDYLFTGWYNNGADWTYQIENETRHTGWTEIGDAWYYLDPETGYRAEGVARVPYPTKEINGITYAPDQESIAYAENKGQTFIDATESWFVFGNDGKFQSDLTGMGTYLDATRYVENGQIAWHPGMVKSGDDYYYFIGDVENGGNIMATGDIYISRDNTDFGAVKSGVYTFAEDGKLCEYDGITAFNGKLRYYENAQLMKGAGLVKLTVDGETKYIYVRSNGELVVDAEYWVAQLNGHTEINEGMANFDENGYMIIEVAQVAKTGVYLEEGKWVYYVEGAKQYNAGLVLLPAETKWFNAAGEVVKELDAEAYVYVRSNASWSPVPTGSPTPTVR